MGTRLSVAIYVFANGLPLFGTTLSARVLRIGELGRRASPKAPPRQAITMQSQSLGFLIRFTAIEQNVYKYLQKFERKTL